jgi:glutaredoxin-like protein NrdH
VCIPVKIYVLSTCPACNELKKLLEDNAIAYEALTLDLLTAEDKARTMMELKELSRLAIFPTIVIGDKVITGYRKQKILRTFRKNSGVSLVEKYTRIFKYRKPR